MTTLIYNLDDLQITPDNTVTLEWEAALVRQRKIAVVWSVEDVQYLRADLNEEQAWTVLQAVQNDRRIYFNIDQISIEYHAEQLFGPLPGSAEITD